MKHHHVPSQPIQSALKNQSSAKQLMPVIKIDFSGRVLYANEQGLKILQKWGCACGSQLPDKIYREHPELLYHQCCTDIELKADQFTIFFSAVAFDEAGFVGLYGYKIKKNSQAIHPLA